MLRLVIVLLLLAANGLMLAWQQGWLGGNSPAQQDREPDRLKRQVNPEQLRVLPPQAASAAMAEAARASAASASAASAPADGAASAPAAAASAAAAAAGPVTVATAQAVAQPASTNVSGNLVCLELGPFALAELPGAEKALRAAAVPAGRWTVLKSERKGSYLIYMGRYADQEALANKQAQLQRLKVDAKPLTNWPDLQPGLVLGRFEDKATADGALARLSTRGVRTARVITITPGVTLATLRLPTVDSALREQLASVKQTLAGIALNPCAGEPHKT
jgi:polygalacturonase